MNINWKQWRNTLSMGFVSLPILGLIGGTSDDSFLHYGSIITVIIYICLYIFVIIKASKKEIYNSEGKTL